MMNTEREFGIGGIVIRDWSLAKISLRSDMNSF